MKCWVQKLMWKQRTILRALVLSYNVLNIFSILTLRYVLQECINNSSQLWTDMTHQHNNYTLWKWPDVRPKRVNAMLFIRARSWFMNIFVHSNTEVANSVFCFTKGLSLNYIWRHIEISNLYFSSNLIFYLKKLLLYWRQLARSVLY
jgi:hypothetical protein